LRNKKLHFIGYAAWPSKTNIYTISPFATALISQPSYNFLASFWIEKDQIFGVVTVCWEIFVQLQATCLIFQHTNRGFSSSELPHNDSASGKSFRRRELLPRQEEKIKSHRRGMDNGSGTIE
jgi:hypothetical protein